MYRAGTEKIGGLSDPSGGPIEDYRRTRDIIKEKVEDLVQRVKNNQI